MALQAPGATSDRGHNVVQLTAERATAAERFAPDRVAAGYEVVSRETLAHDARARRATPPSGAPAA